MTLSVTNLYNDEFLVEGTDTRGTDGRAVLHSPAWAAYLIATEMEVATGVFDKAVRDLFKSVTDAADTAKASIDRLTGNDYNTIVMTEGVDAVLGETLVLDADGVLLNMLSQGVQDFVWVGDRLVAIK